MEQHVFPRDKVCGECLSALGLAVLRRAELLAGLTTDAPVILTQANLHAADGQSVCIPLSGTMWGLSRAVLDLRLLDAARAAGAKVLQPARCEGVEPGERPRVAWRDLQTNRRHESAADVVLVADGKGALLPHRPARGTVDFGIKAHFTGVTGPRNAIELFGVRGHYGGVAPIEGDRWNAAFSVPEAELRGAGGDLDRLVSRIVSQNATLQSRFAAAQRAGTWCASPLPRFAVSDAWPAGVIPIGNAAAALEPIGGEGMGLALRSAEMAAEMLLANGVHATSVLRISFRRLWRVRSAACRVAARVLSSPSMAGSVVELLDGNPGLARMAMALMGKSGRAINWA